MQLPEQKITQDKLTRCKINQSYLMGDNKHNRMYSKQPMAFAPYVRKV